MALDTGHNMAILCPVSSSVVATCERKHVGHRSIVVITCEVVLEDPRALGDDDLFCGVALKASIFFSLS